MVRHIDRIEVEIRIMILNCLELLRYLTDQLVILVCTHPYATANGAAPAGIEIGSFEGLIVRCAHTQLMPHVRGTAMPGDRDFQYRSRLDGIVRCDTTRGCSGSNPVPESPGSNR
jgi:hypothetical protein